MLEFSRNKRDIMKIQTMSVVVGDYACNANCPFCIAKITPNANLVRKDINWRNFKHASRLAVISGATTVLLTGKGEPTLYPDIITSYLGHLMEFEFPFVELQTNGIRLITPNMQSSLENWYKNDLTTICLSAVHFDQKMNQSIYSPDYPKIEELVKILHGIGFTVRLSIMMIKEYIDSWDKVCKLVDFCKENKIKQITIRPIVAPTNFYDNNVSKWTKENAPDEWVIRHINYNLETMATPILKLSHGATVYDFRGQNICMSNCLTTNETDEDIRQIIFYPDGTISYDWKFNGAILL